MKKFKKAIALILCAVMFFVLNACAKPAQNNQPSNVTTTNERETEAKTEQPTTPPKKRETTIKIGVLEPSEGLYSKSGNLESLGAEYANLKRPTIKIGGKKIKIKLVHSEKVTSFETAKAAAKKFASEGVKAVIGSCSGEYSLAAVRFLEEKNIPIISVSTAPVKFLENFKNSFSLSGSDYYIANKIATFAKKNLKLSKVYILAMLGDESSEGMALYCREKLVANGIDTAIKVVDRNETSLKNYVREARKISCDAIFAAVPSNYASDLIDEMEKSPIENLFCTSSWSSDLIFKKAGNSHENIFLFTNLNFNRNNEKCIDFMEWLGSGKKNYELANGEQSGLSFGAIDAYNVIYDCLLKNDSLDSKKLLEALKSYSGKGISGEISFDKTGARKRYAGIFKLTAFGVQKQLIQG